MHLINVPTDPTTGKSNGFAVVKVECEVDIAIYELRNQCFDDRELIVCEVKVGMDAYGSLSKCENKDWRGSGTKDERPSSASKAKDGGKGKHHSAIGARVQRVASKSVASAIGARVASKNKDWRGSGAKGGLQIKCIPKHLQARGPAGARKILLEKAKDGDQGKHARQLEAEPRHVPRRAQAKRRARHDGTTSSGHYIVTKTAKIPSCSRLNSNHMRSQRIYVSYHKI